MSKATEEERQAIQKEVRRHSGPRGLFTCPCEDEIVSMIGTKIITFSFASLLVAALEVVHVPDGPAKEVKQGGGGCEEYS